MNDQNVLNLNLYMGPGPEETRQKLLEMVRRNEPDVFIRPRNTGGWTLIIDDDLPRIEEAVRKETWIWESVEPDPA